MTDRDSLLAAYDALRLWEHRVFFAQRGEAVEWKTRGRDEPPDLPARLLAAGFVRHRADVRRSRRLSGKLTSHAAK